MNRFKNYLGKKINGKTVNIVIVTNVIVKQYGSYNNVRVLINEIHHDESIHESSIYASIGEEAIFSMEYYPDDDLNNVLPGKTSLHLFENSLSKPIEYRIVKNKRIFRPYSI